MRRQRRQPGARTVAALTAAVLAGLLTVSGVRAAAPAQAHWTDTGDVVSGAFTSWALTGVACPAPAWGSNYVLSWSQPSGTAVASVALDADSPPVTGLTSWQPPSAMAPGRDDTDGSPASWGIATNNPLESADFHGTWQLVASAPTVAGADAWTATRTGTWAISFDTALTGTTACAVNP